MKKKISNSLFLLALCMQYGSGRVVAFDIGPNSVDSDTELPSNSKSEKALKLKKDLKSKK